MITSPGLGSEVVHLVQLCHQYDSLVTELLLRPSLPVGADLQNGVNLPETLANIERTTIQAYLEATSGNVKRSAELLKMPRINLYGRIKRYQLRGVHGGA